MTYVFKTKFSLTNLLSIVLLQQCYSEKQSKMAQYCSADACPHGVMKSRDNWSGFSQLFNSMWEQELDAASIPLIKAKKQFCFQRLSQSLQPPPQDPELWNTCLGRCSKNPLNQVNKSIQKKIRLMLFKGKKHTVKPLNKLTLGS